MCRGNLEGDSTSTHQPLSPHLHTITHTAINCPVSSHNAPPRSTGTHSTTNTARRKKNTTKHQTRAHLPTTHAHFHPRARHQHPHKHVCVHTVCTYTRVQRSLWSAVSVRALSPVHLSEVRKLAATTQAYAATAVSWDEVAFCFSGDCLQRLQSLHGTTRPTPVPKRAAHRCGGCGRGTATQPTNSNHPHNQAHGRRVRQTEARRSGRCAPS